jgi:hypothetical protein|tara:strand:+ start:3801 stop:4514 length:714 start_codon:yes stop_codon:yes gene_type:complete
MTEVLVVEKTGNLKSVNVKKFKQDEFYKLAGFKNNNKEDFKFQTKWETEVNKKKYNISVYGKTDGRANQENKYDFPPPVDNTLFFGGVLLINKKGDSYVSLSLKEWKAVYENLFGGFEDLNSDNDDEDEEDDEDEDLDKTDTGYAKDGFVVEDEEEEEDEEEDDDELEDEIEDYDDELEDEIVEDDDIIEEKPKKEKGARRSSRLKNKSTENIFTFNDEETDEFDCTSELKEEEYFV